MIHRQIQFFYLICAAIPHIPSIIQEVDWSHTIVNVFWDKSTHYGYQYSKLWRLNTKYSLPILSIPVTSTGAPPISIVTVPLAIYIHKDIQVQTRESENELKNYKCNKHKPSELRVVHVLKMHSLEHYLSL